MMQLVPIPITSEKGVLMHTPPSHPARPWRRLLGVAMALPLLAAGTVAAPASANAGITVEGRYNTAGAGCHGSDNAEGCLSWGVRVPSAITPKGSTNVTIEADSVPGQWTWTCPTPDGDKVAGTSAFYIKRDQGEPPAKLAESDLGLLAGLYYNHHGDSAGSVKAITCTPEHLSLTYEVNFNAAWDKSSYLDLDLGATAVKPGADTRSYHFTPTIDVSTRNAILRPTVTAQKPAASAPHATVTTEAVKVDGAAKDAGRFTMKAKNDSTTPLSDFTISASRGRGQAQVTALTCDLTAFGGEVVSAKGPAESLKVSSGTAKVPQGKEITCQVDLTGIAGRNTITAGLTTGDQTFSSDFFDYRPVGEVTVQPTDLGVEADPTGTYEVEVGYTVTFTNTTDADGYSSDIVLRPHLPAGFTLKSVWGTGVPWWITMDDYIIEPDGSVSLSTAEPLYAGSSTTMTFLNTYTVNAEAITEDGWKALGTCDAKDPSKGLTTQIDVADSGAGIEAASFAVCTAVTRTKN